MDHDNAVNAFSVAARQLQAASAIDDRPGQEAAMGSQMFECYPSESRSSGQARHGLTAFLRELGQDALIPAAVLLISELVTNAVLHAPGPIEVKARWANETLHVDVHDVNTTLPQLRKPNGGGRGLHVVAELATKWGSTRSDGDGKVTWFELRTG